ncbi:MAG: hypothetical protein A2925_02765 [Candidatus Yanofskybacteria bacterium RIFCSPLOWO2_01_FULL_44_22]|uniref:Uncharacterized protein n=1 Tax=Candidatus Yanofskybacteria bacterium RIFCSPLOWO2_01_FULL_44_22 TaxID=1802697 RepID=A0A1F8GIB3_9BACT|nr:MAG: hypothetical protein A2659_04395 [Candidatus Yanofskybacteria bacterium RIFCSPHIGHO2_01_FULL_44_24]OGN25135.1 MAG: hypothetical protein A2925_02765 [Candidatus Yanofskybacteria bacterium RIFCSPLOWO2_01_FULL_44_22]
MPKVNLDPDRAGRSDLRYDWRTKLVGDGAPIKNRLIWRYGAWIASQTVTKLVFRKRAEVRQVMLEGVNK